jgi:2-dehydropantoate 2-reductase
MQAATGTSTGKDAVVRYWTLAATKIDEPRGKNPSAGAVRELAASLSRAGLRTKLELGVHETNPATTVCLIPIGMAIAVAGDVSSLLADEQLLELTSRACREGVRLAHRIGAPEPWARLAPVFSAPWALRVWLGGLAKTSPEALFYAEEHFGRKLTAQHRIMIREMADLTRDRGLPHAAIDELARRLEALD